LYHPPQTKPNKTLLACSHQHGCRIIYVRRETAYVASPKFHKTYTQRAADIDLLGKTCDAAGCLDSETDVKQWHPKQQFYRRRVDQPDIWRRTWYSNCAQKPVDWIGSSLSVLVYVCVTRYFPFVNSDWIKLCLYTSRLALFSITSISRTRPVWDGRIRVNKLQMETCAARVTSQRTPS
jgi:hypothetical protein